MSIAKLIAITTAMSAICASAMNAFAQSSRLESDLVVRGLRGQINRETGSGTVWFQIQNNSKSDWRVSVVHCEIKGSDRVVERDFDVSMVVLSAVPIRESRQIGFDALPQSPKFNCHVSRAQRCGQGGC